MQLTALEAGMEVHQCGVQYELHDELASVSDAHSWEDRLQDAVQNMRQRSRLLVELTLCSSKLEMTVAQG